MLYGYLSYLNNRFYSQLAVDPSDVGLGYATTLARSGGLILVVVLAVGIAQYLLLRGLLGLMGGVFHESPSMFVVGGLLVLLLWFALPVFLYPFTEPTREVDAAVRQAKVGLPVAPVRIYGAVAIMTLRADAAVVEQVENQEHHRLLTRCGRARISCTSVNPTELPCSSIRMSIGRCTFQRTRW
jgi:hypothetical protein